MMNVGVRIGAVVGIGLLACMGAPALAALPDPLAEGLRHCASESDQAKRLACFDALAAGLPKVEADQFGLTADIARKRQPPKKSQPTAPTTADAVADPRAAGGPTGTAASGAAMASTIAKGSATTATPGAAATTSVATTSQAAPKPAGQFLPGKITALRQGSGGVLVFTLDNDQVWAQANADTRFTFNIGDDVRIEHGSMGSFWLAANKGRKTRVKRIS